MRRFWVSVALTAISFALAVWAWPIWGPGYAGDFAAPRVMLSIAAMFFAVFRGLDVAAGADRRVRTGDAEAAGAPLPGGGRLYVGSRWRSAILAVGCTVIAACYWAVSVLVNPVVTIVGVAVFAPLVVINVRAIMSPAWLRLDGARFEIKDGGFGRPRRVAWADVDPLYVAGTRDVPVVAYRYREGREPALLDWLSRLRAAIKADNTILPVSLPVEPGSLCALMNRMRGAAAGGAPADLAATTGLAGRQAPAP